MQSKKPHEYSEAANTRSTQECKVKGDEKSLIENNLVTNIVVFGDEVNIDITIHNPTLHAKKQVEVDILKAIHEKLC